MSNAKVVANYQKVKTHLRENKKVYIAGAACFVVGTASAVLTTRQFVIVDSWNISYKSPKVNVVQTSLQRRGHPGNVVRCCETGELFASQNRAATVLNLNAAHLAQHLQGRNAHVKGYTFEKLGEA